MRKSVGLTIGVGIISAWIVACGCNPGPKKNWTLDTVAQSIEKFGTVSVSAPLLVPVESVKAFDFDLDRKAEFFYDASRIEGAVRQIQQEAFDVQFALKLQIEEITSAINAIKAAKPEDVKSAEQRLTKSALALAALQQIASSPEAAASLSANPALRAGLGFLVEQMGGQVDSPPQTTETAPDEVPDNAAPAKTVNAEEPNTENVGSSGTAGNGQTEGEFKSLLPLARPAKDVLTGAQFSAPLPAYSGTITISPRQALSLAANDKMTQDLFKWFAKPNGYDTKNKQAYFCMMTVSCQPGYATREGFSADVLVTTEYAQKIISQAPSPATEVRDPADANGEDSPTRFFDRKLLDNESNLTRGGPEFDEFDGRQPKSGPLPVSSFQYSSADNSHSFTRPLVAAVYPMVDSQVLDLREGLRRQLAMAAQLALLGFGSQAEILADYVKRAERDAQTASAFTVGSAYSAGGYNFGFRIEPRFFGLREVANPRSAPGYRLESTEFPAMVLLFADRDDLGKHVGGAQAKGGYDHVVFHIEPRWLPMTESVAKRTRLSEDEIKARASVLSNTLGPVTETSNSQDKRSAFNHFVTIRRGRTLAAAGLGATIVSRLPDTSIPPTSTESPEVVRASSTYFGWQNAASVFVVEGKNFSKNNVHGAIAGGRNCSVSVASQNTAIVVCDAWGDQTTPKKVLLELVTSKGSQPAGEIDFAHLYDVTREKARPSIAVERDPRGNITGVTVTGDFTKATDLLKIVQGALECCDEHHSICAQCGCFNCASSACCCPSEIVVKPKHETSAID